MAVRADQQASAHRIGGHSADLRHGTRFAVFLCTMWCSVDKPSPGPGLIMLIMMSCGNMAVAEPHARANLVMAPAAIAGAAEAGVRQALGNAASPANDAGVVLHVRAQPPDPRLRLATCQGALATRLETERIAQGRALVRVTCDQPVWSVFVPVRVETETEVLVASRPLHRGSAVSAEAVRLERRRLSGVTENYVKSADELRRYRLRRPLVPGALLARDALEPAPVVRRGSIVTLRAESGGFRIDAAGRALADAAPGMRVRVQNAASLKVVEGVADDVGIVRLDP
jgi:flagella basal body P-ring formation protein FlgA